jgi:hypothetical protein
MYAGDADFPDAEVGTPKYLVCVGSPTGRGGWRPCVG